MRSWSIERSGPLAAILLSWLTITACAASGTAPCTLTVDEQQWSFRHLYAVRAHDPYDMDDSTRLTRVVCFEDAVDSTVFATEESFVDFVMQYEGGMATVDVRDNGEVVGAGYAIGEGPVVGGGPFGGYSEVQFEGSTGPDTIQGAVATNTPLADPEGGDSTFSISMQIERPIDATW